MQKEYQIYWRYSKQVRGKMMNCQFKTFNILKINALRRSGHKNLKNFPFLLFRLKNHCKVFRTKRRKPNVNNN